MRRYALLGLAVYLLFVVSRFPAATAIAWFAPDGITVYAPQGSIWTGSAQGINKGSINLGPTEWRLAPLRLLTGKLSADVKTGLGKSKLNAALGKSVLGDTITLANVQGIIFLEDLPPNLLPQKVNGRVALAFEHIRLEAGWPTDARGSVDLVDLSLVSPLPVKIGSFEILYGEQQSDTALTGTVTDTDSPLSLDGTLSLNADRSYQLDGTAQARDEAPQEIKDALQFLGESDPSGGVRIGFQGQISDAQ